MGRKIVRKTTAYPLSVALLIVAIALVMFRAADAHNRSLDQTESSAGRNVVRSYYAAVETYFKTGDLSGVRSVFEPGTGATTHEWYLHALRATYPRVSIEVVGMQVDGDSVTAEIMVDAGPPDARQPLRPNMFSRAWRASESFRIRDERVIGYFVTGSGVGFFAPQGSIPVHRPVAGQLAMVTALVTLPEQLDRFLALPGPAIATIVAGSIEVQGNGVAGLRSGLNLSEALLAPGVVYRAGVNDALLMPNGRTVIRNVADEEVRLVVALLVPERGRAPIGGEHAESQPVDVLDSLAAAGASVESVTGPHPIEGTIGELHCGWVVLDAGEIVDSGAGVRLVGVVPIDRIAGMKWHAPDQARTISNSGTGRGIAWVVLVSPEWV